MRTLGTSLIAAGFALALGGLLLALLGAPPLEAYRGMAASCLARLGDTLAKAALLTLLGTSVAVAFRAGFWNVGAEGQLCAGAAAAAGVGLFLAPHAASSPVFWSAAALAAGALAGALWCLLPALLRVRLGASEVVTTLMLVYVARRGMEYLYLGPWKDPQGYGFPGTESLAPELLVPLSGIVALAVLLAVVCGVIVSRTTLGYEMGILCESWDVARYAGVRVERCLGLTAALSGGLAGLAGAAQVASTAGRLVSGISVGDGFTAVIVACLAGRQPLGVLLAAPLWAVLKVGAQDLEISYRIPQAFSASLEGICLLCWLAAVWLARRRARTRGAANVA